MSQSAKWNEIKARVDRFVKGERSSQDLRIMFIWLGEQANCARSIKEIRDFHSHPDGRDRGISNEKARLITNNIVLANFFNNYDGIIDNSNMSVLRTIIMDKFDLSDGQDVFNIFGQKKEDVRKALKEALPYFIGLRKGIPVSTAPLSYHQSEVLRTLSTDFLHIDVSAVLSDDIVIEELFHSLDKSGLVNNSDYSSVLGHRDWVAAYCLSALHLTSIKLAGGAYATLQVGLGYFEDSSEHLALNCAFKLRQKGTTWIFPLFATNLLPKNWCDPALWPILEERRIVDDPLECDSKGVLRLIS